MDTQGSRVEGLAYMVTWNPSINDPEMEQTREMEYVGTKEDGTLIFRHPERRNERSFIPASKLKNMQRVDDWKVERESSGVLGAGRFMELARKAVSAEGTHEDALAAIAEAWDLLADEGEEM